jgi:type I restriction enzyme S subunit
MNNGKFGEYGKYMFDKELITWSVDGGGQLFYRPKHKFSVTNVAGTLEVLNGTRLDCRYLHYVLSDKHTRLKFDWIRKAHPSVIRRLYKEIPVPPVVDQRRIAHLLVKVEGLITQRKQHLQQLDELLKSVFLEMFGDPVRNEKGWETGASSVYADLVTVGVVVKPAAHYVEHGVIALRSLNIKPNRIDLKDLVYFSQHSSDGILSKSRLQTNDVVVVRTGKTGTAAVVPASLNGANCIDLIVVRPKPSKVHPQFLTCLLNSERGMALVSSLEVGGIQKHFNVGALNKIPFPIPPIALQAHFADIVEKVESTKTRYQQSLIHLEALYGALSQKAFKGELDLSRVPLPDMSH